MRQDQQKCCVSSKSVEIKRAHEVYRTVNGNQLICVGQQGCYHGDVLAGQCPRTRTQMPYSLNQALRRNLDALCLSVFIVFPCVRVCLCECECRLCGCDPRVSFWLEQCCLGHRSCQVWNSVFPKAKWVRTAESQSVSWKNTQASHTHHNSYWTQWAQE